MRRRLALLAAASTAIVVLGFAIPLAVLIWTGIRRDAVDEAQARVDLSAALLKGVADAESASLVAAEVTANGPYEVYVYMADGITLGTREPADAGVQAAFEGEPFRGILDGTIRLATPSFGPDGSVLSVSTVGIPLSGLIGRTVPWVAGLVVAALVLPALVGLVAHNRAGRIVAPIDDLVAVTDEVRAGNLNARVEPSGTDEVRELGESFNTMTSQLRSLVDTERELVADLSHRLRTPVTALTIAVDRLLPDERLERVSELVERLSGDLDRVIAEARGGIDDAADSSSCDAAEVVRDRFDFWAPYAEEEGREIGLHIGKGYLVVQVSAGDLEAAVDVLLGNVFAHTPDGTAFRLCAEKGVGNTVVVAIEDSGPGIADASALARGVSGGGSSGLGLDIARRTAALTGGRLEVGVSDTGGARVEMILGRPR